MKLIVFAPLILAAALNAASAETIVVPPDNTWTIVFPSQPNEKKEGRSGELFRVYYLQRAGTVSTYLMMFSICWSNMT